MSNKPLEEEIQYYNKIKTELLKNHAGKFALIHGSDFIGAFDNAQNAYDRGVELFGSKPFLIKLIVDPEPSEQIPAFFLGLTNASIS
jgi:hypothetical protein